MRTDEGSSTPSREQLQEEVDALRATVALLQATRESAGPRGEDGERLAPDSNLRSVMEGMPSSVAVLDEAGRLLAANRMWREQAQAGDGPPGRLLEGGEARGEGEAATFADDVREVVAGRRGGFVREFAWSAPGSRRWYRGRVLRLEGMGRILVSLEDVTERRQSGEVLAEREALLKSLLDSAPMMMGVVELDEGDIRLLAVNHPVAGSFGPSPEELRGRRLGELGQTSPERIAYWVARYEESQRSGKPVHFEYEESLAEGRRWLAAHANYVGDGPEGRPRFSFIVEDMTEHRQSEEALRRYAERLLILHQIDISISADQTPGEIALYVLRQLLSLVPYWRASVVRFEEGTQRGENLATVGHASPFEPGKVHEHGEFGPPGEFEALWDGDCVEVPDVGGLPVLPTALRLLVAEGMRSYLRVPLRIRGRALGVLSLYGAGIAQFTPEHREIARQVGDSLAVAIEHARLLDGARASRERLRELSRQLIRVQEEERRSLARELHDEVGQALTLIRLGLRRALDAGGGPAAMVRLAECDELIDQTLAQVRGLSLDLRPSHLDDLGLVPALRSYLATLARRAGLVVHLEADELDGLHPDIATACFRIAQEALTNVVRHARAGTVWVALRRSGPGLELELRDDGVGYDVGTALAHASAGGSLGLLSMMERAALLDGRTELDSAPGRGARVRATLPLAPAAHPESGALPGRS
jgi:PAS domain S-box-containing protein